MSNKIQLPELAPGEHYAGITLVGNKAARLYLLPGDIEKNWKDAGEWAKEQGGELPSRMDALVLWQNVPKQFSRWGYWTSEQHADNASCAWIQSFYFGDQTCSHKDDDHRVRAVRRVIIGDRDGL